MGERLRGKNTEKVVVHVRLRPFTEDEQARHGRDTTIDMFEENKRVITVKKDYDRKTYTFDSLFGMNSTQEGIYSRVGEPVTNSILRGYNGTIFAYG